MVVGAAVCRTHGGSAPQVRARRAERIALAEELAAAPYQHPGDVLLGAVRPAEALVRQAEREVAEHGATDRAKHDLREAVITSAALSRSALSAEAEDRSARFAERQVAALDRALGKFLRGIGRDDPDARDAFAHALATSTSPDDGALRSAASIWAQPKRAGDFVADTLEAVLDAVGLKRDEWARAQWSTACEAIGRGERHQVTPPPRDTWELLLRRAARELHLPDPLPTVEILPPRRRVALTDGRP